MAERRCITLERHQRVANRADPTSTGSDLRAGSLFIVPGGFRASPAKESRSPMSSPAPPRGSPAKPGSSHLEQAVLGDRCRTPPELGNGWVRRFEERRLGCRSTRSRLTSPPIPSRGPWNLPAPSGSSRRGVRRVLPQLVSADPQGLPAQWTAPVSTAGRQPCQTDGQRAHRRTAPLKRSAIARSGASPGTARCPVADWTPRTARRPR